MAYTVSNQWNNGFTANVTITNTGTSTINGWTLVFSFPNGQQLTSEWSGNFTQQGAQVTVTNLSYNGSISAGGSTSIGFNASYNGTNTNPTSFKLNSQQCTTA
ncbi:cellulose binding domain-containing protein [Ktedonobacter racemifer]|uniref:cellulose binding domain-containing protein n=1 Tax=Ktedonobacter racemifer TaxID=363277 RepID=UPI000A014814|nr:cellulose binding domain-containing protein [Ktedonobacter racemifer]